MDSKDRFTNKVDDYVKYRPSYPVEFIGYLLEEVGLRGVVVADVGAGTGILTRQLAPAVGKIYAVEPNLNMRTACEEYCREYGSFAAADGSAENTGLAGESVDFITVAQAFHWFDAPKTKAEFQRIIKPGGRVVLVWNSRVSENRLIREIDELCERICPDFGGQHNGRRIDPEEYGDFFKNGCAYRVFDNDRLLTLETFIGSNLSSSYAPGKNDEKYNEFVGGLKKLFEKYSRNGMLLLPNKTYSYVGGV